MSNEDAGQQEELKTSPAVNDQSEGEPSPSEVTVEPVDTSALLKRACRLDKDIELRGVTYRAGTDVVLKLSQVEFFKDNIIEIDGVSTEREEVEEGQ